MRTAAQIAASKRNAQRSTGPRTAGGKRICSRNAKKHGLRATTASRPDPELLQAIAKELQPANRREYLAVLTVAIAFTNERVVKALEDHLILVESAHLSYGELVRRYATYSRYDAAWNQRKHRALDLLLSKFEESTTSPAPFVQKSPIHKIGEASTATVPGPTTAPSASEVHAGAPPGRCRESRRRTRLHLERPARHHNETWLVPSFLPSMTIPMCSAR